jgi:hypothetical protein
MLRSYLPIHGIALSLGSLKESAAILKGSGSYSSKVSSSDADRLRDLLAAITRECPKHGLIHSFDMAARVSSRTLPVTNIELFQLLNHLSDVLSNELAREAILRFPPERKEYYLQDALFGQKVRDAFPSCATDVEKAGRCYALGQEDGCVHHLMLVLERGLMALAAKLGVQYQHANWQNIINKIAIELKSLPSVQIAISTRK